MERVKVYDAHGAPERSGRGLFATRLAERFRDLPIEEEGRLSDPALRENFVERVFAYWRLRGLFGGRWNLAALVGFHTAHKLILMAHSPDAYRRLGRFVAGAKSVGRKDIERRYTAGFMAALAVVATPKRHANVLQHMAGYLKNQLDRESKVELLPAVEDYRQWPRATDRADYAAPPLRADSQHRVSGRSGVPGSASERADAAQSRLNSALVFSASR